MQTPQSVSPNATERVIELREVGHTFRVGGGVMRRGRTVDALVDINLAVKRGEVLGVVGESGSGKSTLVRILLGLLRPTAGTVLLGGTDIEQVDRMTFARTVQPVFQDPYASLNPKKRVSEIISLPLRVHRIGDRKAIEDAVRQMMDHVGLPSRAFDAYAHQLSGGQRQRVAIARALVLRVPVVVCDEPTSALDVSIQAQILNLLADLRDELGLTYVIVSHNLAVIEHMATRVAVMYLGRIVELGDASLIFSNPRHPYTEALLASVLTLTTEREVQIRESVTTGGSLYDRPSGCPFHPRCPLAGERCRTEVPLTRIVEGRAVRCHFAERLTHSAIHRCNFVTQ
jgi:peptide/nickel transport system ATP-binding protein